MKNDKAKMAKAKAIKDKMKAKKAKK